jgi:hypothetical protein
MIASAWRLVLAATLIAAACTTASTQQSTNSPGKTLDHITPARDSVGPMPSRFAWTAVDGADSYAVGIWNEVDTLVWRADNIATPFVAWPGGRALDPGTYFWSVTALREGRPIADSGRSAFVVVEASSAPPASASSGRR